MTVVMLSYHFLCDMIKVVMIMYTMEQFIQSSILLAILTLSAVIFSGNSCLCSLFSGILMIVFAVRSLSEYQNKIVFFFQALFSVIFAVLSGRMEAYLIFFECRLTKNRSLQILFPSLAYFLVQAVTERPVFPRLLCNGLILTAVCAIIYLSETLAVKYLDARSQILRAVSVTAVNEMYEKKLNQELVIKNYLVDKNARLEERENISRNIHNSVGHSITAAIMTLDAADMLFDTAPDLAREKMNTANRRIRGSLDTIRRAVRVLDSGSEFIAVNDFISELTAITDSFVMDTMIRVSTDFSGIEGDLSIPREHTEFLTGAVQEFLTNGVRHGNADLFIISVTADTGHIRVSVVDNGHGDFSLKNQQEKIKSGFGLKKLISYAERCGGSVVFMNDNGFKSAVTLPLYREDEHE